MAKVAVVTTAELAPGFRLAGAEVLVATGASDAERWVTGLLTDPEVGVVGVDAAFLDQFDPGLQARLADMVAPVVVAVPTGAVAAGPSEHRARLAGILQRAIGQRISFTGEADR